MNHITTSSQIVRMSSVEISELLGARHDNVKRVVKTLGARGVIELPQFEEVRNHLGQKVGTYFLNRLDSITVVAQISPEFTKALVVRWDELERTVKLPASSQASEIGGLIEAMKLQSAMVTQSLSVMTQVLKTIVDDRSVARNAPPVDNAFNHVPVITKPAARPLAKKTDRLTTLAVGRKLGFLANDTDDMLEGLGLQTYVNNRYVPTKKAEHYLAQSVGSQIRWNEDIFTFLTPARTKKYK